MKSGGGDSACVDMAAAESGRDGRPVCGMTRSAVVDVQAFHDPIYGTYVFKELSLVDLGTGKAEHYLFKPPRDANGRVLEEKFLETRHHGIKWEKGLQEYAYLQHVFSKIRNKYRFVFAKGFEKCDQLEQAMGHPIHELQAFGCPSLRKLNLESRIPQDCPHHMKEGNICAHRQALLLAEWCSFNKEKIDLTDPEVRLSTYHNTWNSYHDPVRLSRYGFVHIRSTKLGIRCVYCGFECPELKSGSNPQKHHEEESNCPTFKKKQSRR